MIDPNLDSYWYLKWNLIKEYDYNNV
jgi:hypothetical protein